MITINTVGQQLLNEIKFQYTSKCQNNFFKKGCYYYIEFLISLIFVLNVFLSNKATKPPGRLEIIIVNLYNTASTSTLLLFDTEAK